jgi:hypothetical protein
MRKVVTFTGKKGADAASDEQSHHGNGCIGHNCPLRGTISDSPAGGNWKCWAHDRLEEASQWPYLTHGINENLWLFKVADRVATMTPVDIDAGGKQAEVDLYLRSRNRDDLVRQVNRGEYSERVKLEPIEHWRRRLREAAYALAKGYVDEQWTRASA